MPISTYGDFDFQTVVDAYDPRFRTCSRTTIDTD